MRRSATADAGPDTQLYLGHVEEAGSLQPVTSMRHRFLRRLSSLALVAFVLVASLSFVPVDEFVTSGEYARARAALANCNMVFFPAMDERDREPLRFASLIPYMPAGRELRYTYRPLELSEGTVRDHSADYEWVEKGDSRWALFESADGSYLISSVSGEMGGNCTRLYMKISPPVLQVGLRSSTVKSTESFLQEFGDLLPKDYKSTVTLPEVKPGEGEVVIKYYRNGAPVPDETVIVSTDARGVPGRYGSTLGHEHIAHGTSSRYPSILIRGQQGPGRDVELRTDSDGEARFWVRAGYRGGPESITARTPSDASGQTPLASAASVVVRHKEFRHFLFALGHGQRPQTGPDFPFILTGWTDRHYYNHFVDPTLAGPIATAFMYIWKQDSARIASPTPRYIVLNDMSLEYGGAFKLANGDACLDPASGSHHTHDRGVDFDVSPCYSTGADGLEKVSAAACETGQHLKINERLLTAYVVGYLGGAIFVHRPSVDGAPYHYHIRFPVAD